MRNEPSLLRTVTIPVNGEQRTGVIDKSNHKFMSFAMPSAWTAADISFLGSMTPDGTFVPIIKGSDGAELTLTVDIDQIIVLDTAALHNLVMAVPFIKLRSGESGELVVEDCEDEWNELEDADLTQTIEATDVKVGAGALKWVIAAGMDAGDIIATEVIAKDLTAYKGIRLWIKCSVATAAGNLKLLLDEHAQCASPEETLSIPALAANTWTQVNLNFAAPGDAALDTLISIGMEYDADIGACTIYLDDVRAVKEVGQAAEREFKVALYN